MTVHDETIELLKTGISYGDLSGGKFDITIGRLSDLWDISTKALLDQTDVSMIPLRHGHSGGSCHSGLPGDSD